MEDWGGGGRLHGRLQRGISHGDCSRNHFAVEMPTCTMSLLDGDFMEVARCPFVVAILTSGVLLIGGGLLEERCKFSFKVEGHKICIGNKKTRIKIYATFASSMGIVCIQWQ